MADEVKHIVTEGTMEEIQAKLAAQEPVKPIEPEKPKKEKVVEPAKKEAKKDGWSWRKFQQWIDNPPK